MLSVKQGLKCALLLKSTLTDLHAHKTVPIHAQLTVCTATAQGAAAALSEPMSSMKFTIESALDAWISPGLSSTFCATNNELLSSVQLRKTRVS